MGINVRTSNLTVIDATLGLNQSQKAVIDVLSQKTIFRDAYWVESDDYTTHHYLQSLTQPAGSDSVYNQGVAWEIGNDRPVVEIIQGLESYSKMDIRFLADHPNPGNLRREKDMSTVEGMGNSVDDRVFYGNTAVGKTSAVSPDQLLGLHPRFNAISGITYNQIQGVDYWPTNVYSAGGTTANVQTSVWAIKWGPKGLFMIYPRGGKKFVNVRPLPEPVVVFDASNRPYEVEMTHFGINFGLGVGDWRNVQRMCNINLGTDAKPWTSDLMVSVLSGFPDGWDGVIMYVNHLTWVQVQLEAKNNANNFHFDEAPWGGLTPYFMTVPISRADRIVNTEPVIT